MSTYKLKYFNITGLAEPIRFLLSYGDLEFEDDRIEYGDESWKNEIKEKMPLGQVPVLEVDGNLVYQHMAICRYLGKIVDLVGENEWEDLQIDMMADTINDFRLKLAPLFHEKDPEKKEEMYEKMAAETIPFYLEKLDAIVSGNNGYFANGKLSWVDLYFVALLPIFNVFTRFDITERYSGLKQVKEIVEELPAIKTWLENRPVTEF